MLLKSRNCFYFAFCFPSNNVASNTSILNTNIPKKSANKRFGVPLKKSRVVFKDSHF